MLRRMASLAVVLALAAPAAAFAFAPLPCKVEKRRCCKARAGGAELARPSCCDGGEWVAQQPAPPAEPPRLERMAWLPAVVHATAAPVGVAFQAGQPPAQVAAGPPRLWLRIATLLI